MRQSPAYVSIARSNHTRLNDAVFPAADFQGPLYVVSEFSATDGTGGTYRNRLQYSGAQLHLQGRGFQGFATQRIEDTRTGLVTLDSVSRVFPYTGMHVQRDVFQANGTTPVRQWQAVLGQQAMGTAGREQRSFPFVASTSARQFELGGVLNGTLVTEASTTFTYGDGYGNPTQVQTTTWDRDPYSPHLNSAWRSTLSLDYTNDTSGNWCLGVPRNRTTTSTAPDQLAVTQTTTYVTDPVGCRITQQVVEPNIPALKVITSFGFDGCGNLNSVHTVGSNPDGTAMPARTASFNYGSRCQLPESATNTAAETTTYEWHYDFGVPARVTDPNGLSTTWSHDPFGRRVGETASDGTRRTWSFQSCGTTGCWGTGELRFLVYDRNYAADGTLIREHHSYFDGYDRPRLREYHGALGTWLHQTFDYDAAGRMVRESTTLRECAQRPHDPHIRPARPSAQRARSRRGRLDRSQLEPHLRRPDHDTHGHTRPLAVPHRGRRWQSASRDRSVARRHDPLRLRLVRSPQPHPGCHRRRVDRRLRCARVPHAVVGCGRWSLDLHAQFAR